MMAERTMPITNGKKVLPSLAIDVGIDDEWVLIDFATVGRDIALLCAIGKSHNILEKVLFSVDLRLAQVLADEVKQSTWLFFSFVFTHLQPLFSFATGVSGTAWNAHRFRQLFLVLPWTAPVKLASIWVKWVLTSALISLSSDLQMLILWLFAALSCISPILRRCSNCGFVFWVVRGRCSNGRTPRVW